MQQRYTIQPVVTSRKFVTQKPSRFHQDREEEEQGQDETFVPVSHNPSLACIQKIAHDLVNVKEEMTAWESKNSNRNRMYSVVNPVFHDKQPNNKPIQTKKRKEPAPPSPFPKPCLDPQPQPQPQQENVKKEKKSNPLPSKPEPVVAASHNSRTFDQLPPIKEFKHNRNRPLLAPSVGLTHTQAYQNRNYIHHYSAKIKKPTATKTTKYVMSPTRFKSLSPIIQELLTQHLTLPSTYARPELPRFRHVRTSREEFPVKDNQIRMHVEQIKYFGPQVNKTHADNRIWVFGTDEQGHSISCGVTDFHPWFYVAFADDNILQGGDILHERVSTCLENLNKPTRKRKREQGEEDNQEQEQNQNQNQKPSFGFVVEKCSRKNMIGWTNHRQREMVCVRLDNVAVRRKVVQELKKWNEDLIVYHDDMSPELQFFYVSKLRPEQWVDISRFQLPSTVEDHKTTCEMEVLVSCQDLHPCPSTLDTPTKRLILIFDIEVLSLGGFPEPKDPNALIFSISVRLQREGELEPLYRCTFSLGHRDEIPNVVQFAYDNEVELLGDFIRFWQINDPDVVMDFNGFKFDVPHLLQRCLFLGFPSWLNLTRFHHVPAKLRPPPKTNKASENKNDSLIYDIVGRVHFDQLLAVKKGNRKFPEHSLKFLAANLLKSKQQPSKDNKDPDEKRTSDEYDQFDPEGNLEHFAKACQEEDEEQEQEPILNRPKPRLQKKKPPPKPTKEEEWSDEKLRQKYDFVMDNHGNDSVAKGDILPELFLPFLRHGPERRMFLGKYNMNDTDVTWKIARELNSLSEFFGMSSLTYVDTSDLMIRGEQIKSMNLIFVQCEQDGWIVNKEALADYYVPLAEGEDPEKYGGGHVEAAKRGFYKVPIIVLDFSSLYPSIMMGFNICYSSFIKTKKRKGNGTWEYDDTWLNLAKEKLKLKVLSKVVNEDKVKSGEDKEEEVYHFVQDVESVLPKILRVLLQARKEDKKTMEAYQKRGDSFMAAVYNGRQLSKKLCCNSLYGFTGATFGYLPYKPLAKTITAQGREMFQKTKARIESPDLGGEVVYGDTDSMFVNCGLMKDPQTGQVIQDETKQLIAQFIKGKTLAAEATKLFPKPCKLELEKIAYRLVLLRKKKGYAYRMITLNENDCPDDPSQWALEIGTKPKFIGVEVVRRDWCSFSKNLIEQFFGDVLIRNNVPLAEARLQVGLNRLVANQVSYQEMAISKSFKGMDNYHTKDPRKLPQVRLAEQNAAKGNPSSRGDRFNYVITESYIDEEARKEKFRVSAKTKEADRHKDYFLRVFHRDEAEEKQLKVDRLWYFDSQIVKPLERNTQYISPKIVPKMLEECRRQLFHQRTGMQNIGWFFGGSQIKSS